MLSFACLSSSKHWKEFFLLKRSKQIVLDIYEGVIVSESTFYNINSLSSGGGIYLEQNPSELVVKRVTFISCNTEENGGAIYSLCAQCFISKVCCYKCVAKIYGQYICQTVTQGLESKNELKDSSLTRTKNENGIASSVINYGNISITGLNLSFTTIKEVGCLQACPNSESFISFSSFSNNAAKREGFVWLSDSFMKNNTYYGQLMHCINFIRNQQILNNKNDDIYFGILYSNGVSNIYNTNFIQNIAYNIFAQFKSKINEPNSKSIIENCYFEKGSVFYNTFIGIDPQTKVVDQKIYFNVQFLKTSMCEIEADHTIEGYYGRAKHLTCKHKAIKKLRNHGLFLL